MKTFINKFKLNEQLLLEYKRKDLKDWAGADLANRYFEIRDKLQAPENDLGYWIKKGSLEEFKNFIDKWEKGDIKSKTQQKKDDIIKGAELVYSDKNWKVYHVTDYSAAKILGSNTTWCITGRYRGSESKGKTFFDQYINQHDLDGGYWFIFDLNHKDHDDVAKYCAGVGKDGRLKFLYNGMQDIEISGKGIPNIPEEDRIQPIPGVKLPYRDTFKIEDGVLVYADTDLSYSNSVEIPDGVIKINDKLFEGWNTSKFLLPNTLKIIGRGAFMYSSAEFINLPPSIEEIGYGAFLSTKIKGSIKIPDKVKVIKSYTFAYTDIESVFMGDNIEYISDAAFEECNKLREFYSKNPVVIKFCKDHGFNCLHPTHGNILSDED